MSVSARLKSLSKVLLLCLVLVPDVFAVNLPCSQKIGGLCAYVTDNLPRQRSFQRYAYSQTPGGEIKYYFWAPESSKTTNISEKFHIHTRMSMEGLCGMPNYYKSEWKQDQYGWYFSGMTYIMIGNYSIEFVLTDKKSGKKYSVHHTFTIHKS
jgi:hypothetical protein